MASHISVVALMLIAGSVISTRAAPSTSLTLETCGVTRFCGINDTFQALCPASTTCDEYLDCNKGVASIRKCDKPFYLFWMTPVFNSNGEKCCQLVFKSFSRVRPGENGECLPSANTKDDNETNLQLKRHTHSTLLATDQKDGLSSGNQQTEESQTPEPPPVTLERPPEEGATKTAETEESKSDSDSNEESTSSATVSSPFLAIVTTILFTLWFRL